MKITIELKRNIHMYNHLLCVDVDEAHYEAIVESAPRHDKTVLIWLDDFGFPKDQVDQIKDQLTQWFDHENIHVIYLDGHGR